MELNAYAGTATASWDSLLETNLKLYAYLMNIKSFELPIYK